MAPKARAPNVAAGNFDPVRWVGKAFLAVVQKDPALYRDLYYFIRERVGNNLAGELVSALHDAGADQFDKPKREMTDEAKAALVERLAKGRKKKGIITKVMDAPGPDLKRRKGNPETLQDLM